MDMFSDLRQFAEAKAWAEEWERTKDSETVSVQSAGRSPRQAGPVSQSLVQRQAEWNEEMKDFQAAADMYLQVIAALHACKCNTRLSCNWVCSVLHQEHVWSTAAQEVVSGQRCATTGQAVIIGSKSSYIASTCREPLNTA